MNDNYLLLIIFFTLLMYFMYHKPKNTFQNKTDNIDPIIKSNLDNNKKDDFDDTMTINNYINSKINKLEKDKENVSDKNTILNKYKQFNQNIDNYGKSLSDNIIHYKESITSSLTNLSNKIDNYNYSNIKDFYDIYENNFSELTPPPAIDEHFLATTAMDTFMGTYSIIPYQFKNLNKVHIVISKYSPPITNNIFIEKEKPTNEIYNTEKDTHIMGIYINDFLIQEYKIDLTNIKKQCENGICSDDIRTDDSNIKGITIQIKEEIPLLIKSTKAINEVEIDTIKHIIFNLGFKIGNKFHLFLVNERFEKRYITPHIDGKKEFIEYQKTNDDLFKIYSTNGTTILHIKKRQTIDKPFQSLIK